MAVITFVTFNAPTKIWSRTSEGIISYPSTVTAAVGGPFIVNPIIVPFDPIHETGGSFWRLTEGPNVGFLVSAHSNSLGYGDITITYDGQPDSYAEGIAKINPLAAWRLLIKDMGGETGGSSHMLTFNAETFVWSRTTTGIIKWPHEFEHEAGGPYAVNPIVVPFDPEHETGGSFWRLTEGPFTGFLVSFWSNELGYGDITVEENPDFDRGPGAVLATLGPGDVVPLPPTGTGDQPAHLAGASLTYNTGGEMHFTLLVDSPFIDIPQPKRTHYAIEFYDTDAEEWYESFAGWIWDFDATDTEVVFYGIDYLGAFQYTIDERYDPELGIEVAAPNGSKYTNKTIREIVIDQIDYALSRPNSMVGFIVRGDIAPMPYVISAIYSTFKDTLSFVVGLLDSHRAGTGKYTRMSVRKIDGVYTVVIEDDPGVDRDNLLIQYGGLAQGYRTIPFGLDWASRVNFIGRNKEGLKVMYRAESSAVDQGLYGRIASAPVYMDTEDYNDMKRRALQAAIDASRIGRLISAGLKLGSFRPLEGYDICDNLPVDINHGAVTTKDWGSDDFGIDPPDDPSGVSASYWTILGLTWESYDDGHWMTGLTIYPKGKRPVEQPGDVFMMGFMAQRATTATGPFYVPYGRNNNGCLEEAITDGWTHLGNAYCGWEANNYPIDAFFRQAATDDEPSVHSVGDLQGTSRPTGYFMQVSGACSPPVYMADAEVNVGTGTPITPMVVAPANGWMFAMFSMRMSDNSNNDWVVVDPPEIIQLGEANAQGGFSSFSPRSWLGYQQVTAGQEVTFELSRNSAPPWACMVVFLEGENLAIEEFQTVGSIGSYLCVEWAIPPSGVEGGGCGDLLLPTDPLLLLTPSELVIGDGPP